MSGVQRTNQVQLKNHRVPLAQYEGNMRVEFGLDFPLCIAYHTRAYA